jgi:hypothetical protein
MTDPTTHCQICARAIRAKTGWIAHHGYTRPEQGWQTSSCQGARHLPYEVSCSQIADTIDEIEAWIANTQQRIDEDHASPPAKLVYAQERYGRPTGELVTLVQPEGFDPAGKRGPWHRPAGYAEHFDAIRRDRLERIAGSWATIEALRQRQAAWSPVLTMVTQWQEAFGYRLDPTAL